MNRCVLDGSNTIIFSTKDVEEKRRFDYWNELVCDQVINVDCEKGKKDAAFYGSLRIEKYNDVTLSEMHSHSARFTRKNRHIQKADCDFILLTQRLDSRASKIIDSRPINIISGDLSFYHGTRESRLHVNGNIEALIYQIPLTYLDKYIANPEDLHGSVISGESHLGKITGNYMLALASQMSKLDSPVRSVVLDNFLQLLSVCLAEHKRPLAVQPECIQLSRTMQIKDFILLNLADMDLSPEHIANRFNISLRYLYNLFNSENTTLCQFITKERLNCAKTQLMDTSANQKSISEIAFDSGFSNISHFCKLFKKKYKFTPSEFREYVKCREEETL